MPHTRLRSIALLVTEPSPGCFAWKLLESVGQSSNFAIELGTSGGTFPSYSQAIREGEAVLLALAQRSAAGPRAPVLEVVPRLAASS